MNCFGVYFLRYTALQVQICSTMSICFHHIPVKLPGLNNKKFCRLSGSRRELTIVSMSSVATDTVKDVLAANYIPAAPILFPEGPWQQEVCWNISSNCWKSREHSLLPSWNCCSSDFRRGQEDSSYPSSMQVKVGHEKGCESTLRRLRGKEFDIVHKAAQIKLIKRRSRSRPSICWWKQLIGFVGC
ncbi:uncharacterized protein LOC110708548 isoform X2 [Chenopodium quinoa]|uniref:uncharacterized protein LOC110708548 isoform X2 n=1 Tax=Chenopodium quinoa TaxID=63459 RepID=UPI000B788ED2|nr:uncharacterized protein LOC110708548 isoform X2 [Chenopodium quinoa]